ncbi:MAG: alcohol dehydrogenase, partial [Deltaproteobacteria bacterium]|nr:alcohol dehydrogenase [Deltaproteobacteria bacterium]
MHQYMQAVQYSKLGSPDVLQYTTVNDPVITDDQVCIKVAFASINHTDIHFRRGLPGMQSNLPHI